MKIRAEIIEKAIRNMVDYASEGDQTTWDNIISLWQVTLFIIAIRFGLRMAIPDPIATGPWFADDNHRNNRYWMGHTWLPVYCIY